MVQLDIYSVHTVTAAYATGGLQAFNSFMLLPVMDGHADNSGIMQHVSICQIVQCVCHVSVS